MRCDIRRIAMGSDSSHGNKGEAVLHGIGVSPGVVFGPVYVLKPEVTQIQERRLTAEDVPGEIQRLEDAVIETRRQIRRIQDNMQSRTALNDAGVLDAHMMVLDDRSFIEDIIKELLHTPRNVEHVVKVVAERYASALLAVQDEYIRERVVDVQDVARRLMRNLAGDTEFSLARLPRRHIIAASDLAPSETASLRRDRVVGFVTDLGSPTSHTAVMARALEIPAVVGMHDVTEKLDTGDEVLVDGNKGILIIKPSEETLEKYGRVAEKRRNIVKDLSALRDQPAETRDGRKIVIAANAENEHELASIREHGAEGVGLFRSEYMYLSSKGTTPDELQQAKVYSAIASGLAPATVIIRTLDLGGDKFMLDAALPRESNPFLGCRSIRLCLLYPEHFKAQLRAILRASVAGNVKIMYPMISSVGEIIKANEYLEEAKRELAAEGVPFDKNIEVGIMIEIPAAAMTADVLAPHVKFFSIGTNDLIQYTIAVDRVNERVAYLYEPTHPAVLRLIKMTIEAAHRHGIWVGVCGEMAADPMMTALLVGMGIDELSMSPSAVPLVKDAVRSMTMVQAKQLAETALEGRSAMEVLGHCRKMTEEIAPELLEIAVGNQGRS